jgi:hypothetical protein
MWKGAVSFGLVYIPVEMYSAARSSTLDLNLLDSRDFAPVGYQRINKRTGKSVEWGDIVKGYEYKKGEYVALSDEDFRQANVKASQIIEITSFTNAQTSHPSTTRRPTTSSRQREVRRVTRCCARPCCAPARWLSEASSCAAGSTLEPLARISACCYSTHCVLLQNCARSATWKWRRRLRKRARCAQRSGDGGKAPRTNERALEARRLSRHLPRRPDAAHRGEGPQTPNARAHAEREEHPKEGRKSAEVIDLMAVLKKSLESRSAVQRALLHPVHRVAGGDARKAVQA